MTYSLTRICCSKNDTLKNVLKIFNDARSHNLPSGICLVLNDQDQLLGTITEGDVRRALLQGNGMETKAKQFMTSDPITFQEGVTMSDILDLLPNELIKRNRKASKFLNKIILVNKDNVPVKVFEYHELWEQHVGNHRHLVIVGLGYVGLTMAVVLADAGFMVTGVEIDTSRYNMLSKGESYIHEVGLAELLKEQLNKNLFLAIEIPKDGDVYIISVGTPVITNADGLKEPIMNYLLDATEKIAENLNTGNLVILRSTVPIGTSRNIVKNKLEEISGLRCGIDFHLAFAPERTAEGNALKELRSLPQIVGGYNKDSTEATAAIFRDLTPTIVKVDSLEAAEMAKLMNNTFRDYVFAYANQMAIIASEFNINVHSAIKAANQGYARDPIPLPSPGVGGPCLTKDPHIFASVANKINVSSEIFIKGRLINESMHNFIYQRVNDQVKNSGKKIVDCNVLICGLAFKGNPETGDIRNSTSLEIAYLFKSKVKSVFVYDAVAEKEEVIETGLIPVSLPQGFKDMDVVLFLNNHKEFEKINIYDMVRAMNTNPIIFDGWNLLRAEDIISIRPCTFMGLSYTRTSITTQ